MRFDRIYCHMAGISVILIILNLFWWRLLCPPEKTIEKWEKVDSMEINVFPGENENYLRIANNKNFLSNKNGKCYYYTVDTPDGGTRESYVTGNVVCYDTDKQPRIEKWVGTKQIIHRNRLTHKCTTREGASPWLWTNEQYRFYIPPGSIKQQ